MSDIPERSGGLAERGASATTVRPSRRIAAVVTGGLAFALCILSPLAMLLYLPERMLPPTMQWIGSPLLALFALGLAVAALVLDERVGMRVALAVGLLVLVSSCLIFLGPWMAEARHDRLLAELSHAVCERAERAPGVASCGPKGRVTKPPGGGNSCLYTIVFKPGEGGSPVLQFPLYDREAVELIVEREGLSADWNAASPSFVGNPEGDPRCEL